MFYCEVTGKLVEQGNNSHRIITKFRDRNYIYLKDNGSIREVTEEELHEVYKKLPHKFKEKFEEKRVIRSIGFEPVEVLNVCQEVYDKHVENGGLTC